MNIYTYIHNSVLNLTKPWINNLWSAARALFIFLLYEWLYLKSSVIFFLLSGLHPYGCFLGIVAPPSWTLFVFTTMVIGLCGRWLTITVALSSIPWWVLPDIKHGFMSHGFILFLMYMSDHFSWHKSPIGVTLDFSQVHLHTHKYMLIYV